MQPLRVFNVIPKVPAELEPLWQIAHNYLFAWNNQLVELFTYIDPELWEQSYSNPVWFLNHVSQSRYEELLTDEAYLRRLQITVQFLDSYLNAPSEHRVAGLEDGQPAVAYFSLEFGVAPCLPIYSGGLGILAGDHLKSASDMNVPLVGIGFAYRNGYFRQYMTPDGWQQESYPDYDFEQMPMRRALAADGSPAVVHMTLGDRPLAAQIWECKVGRISLFLLDTNIAENPQDFRQITARLYGGNNEMRLWQEMLLGVGGVRALDILDLHPRVIHMNEGHSAFAGLERIRLFMQRHQINFEAAAELTAAGSVFTTHTPVPAGNDRFPQELMRKYFENYARDLGLAFKVFMALGRENPHDDSELFCMTVLALRLSRFSNGVSRLHGKVSRHMWRHIWPQYPEEDLPIGSITNGVHVPTWIGGEMNLLYERFLGPTWRESTSSAKTWARVSNIPDQELWRSHERQRANLIDFVRKRLKRQLEARGARPEEVRAAEEALNPNALTIGFARRFATYKRANMLLQDKESLLRIISSDKRPVQFIFAGKAHPQDNEGKQLLREIIALFREPEYQNKMVFLEDYDMDVAKNMICGCDIWLNNPRRPQEACGTSGMKAMFNGVLQFSTLDGWWDEAWKKDNSLGWAIGKGEEYSDIAYQDQVELHTLYQVLEHDIIPEFFHRPQNNDVPHSWIARIKQALAELGPRFSSNRMLEDYINEAYMPSFQNNLELCKDNFKSARELSEWRMSILTQWGNVKINNVIVSNATQLFVGDSIKVEANIFTAGIPAEHLQIEIYAGKINQDSSFISRDITLMRPDGEMHDGWQRYSGTTSAIDTGRYGLSVRALPRHPLLPNQHFGLIHWADVN